MIDKRYYEKLGGFSYLFSELRKKYFLPER